jgi:hypothetical protein
MTNFFCFSDIPDFKLSATQVDVTTCLREKPRAVNLIDLERQNLPNVENLTNLGFFSVAANDDVYDDVKDTDVTKPRRVHSRRSRKLTGKSLFTQLWSDN